MFKFILSFINKPEYAQTLREPSGLFLLFFLGVALRKNGMRI